MIPHVDEVTEPINVSALNQYAYCPRRCGLIYLEAEFDDNLHTSRGKAEHERVDQVTHVTTCEGTRVETSLSIWSDRLGLIGKCDVVEFWTDGTIYPVEYKHGRRHSWINDDLQLAAQALCLEEMTGEAVRKGAIYHHSSRRRREVVITDTLRLQVQETVLAIRALFASGTLPPPVNDKRCKECSLKEICQPEAIGAAKKIRTMYSELFSPEDGCAKS